MATDDLILPVVTSYDLNFKKAFLWFNFIKIFLLIWLFDHAPFFAITTGITFFKWPINLAHFYGVRIFLYSNMAFLTSSKLQQNLDATKAFISRFNIDETHKSHFNLLKIIRGS